MKMLCDEPAPYDEVLGRIDFSKWQAAMENEHSSLVEQRALRYHVIAMLPLAMGVCDQA
jgi:hypothetical protein